MIPSNAVTKSDGWETFEKLMTLVEDKIHLEEDGRYEFEVILNEE